VLRRSLVIVMGLSAAALAPSGPACAGTPAPIPPPRPALGLASGPVATRPAPALARGAAASSPEAADVSYWTAERMAGAKSFDSLTAPSDLVRPMATAPPGTPQGTYFNGLSMVGTFFSDTSLGSTYCTGSVVDSPGHNIVLTAGHCAKGMSDGKHRIFVPQFRNGQSAANQPYGVYTVDQIYTDSRYKANSKDATSNFDFAFLHTKSSNGANVQDRTGALTLTRTPSYNNTVNVIGYPGSHNTNKQAIQCVVPTTRLPNFNQMQMKCKGYYDGVSGGPWITDYDANSNTGKVIGNVGGYNGGGDDADDDWLTYSPYYDQNIFNLYTQAVTGASSSPPSLPDGPGTWKNAMILAAGDYTGSGTGDLIVIWIDGEVTLYPGDGNGGFEPERQLTPPNTRFKNAVTATGGDFDGNDDFDLLVVFSDGSVSNFEDIGTDGLAAEIVMNSPGTFPWTNAKQITAGRFGDSQYVTDLIVRWSDGELTLYTDVGSGHFGTEHQLEPPNDTWTNATLLTSGQFDGTGTWDLMVQWVDGEFDTYPGTSPSGLGPEQRVQNPNQLWTNNKAMTAGDFTGNGRYDDVIVRWIDGETSMYVDSTAQSMGTEVTLVPPPS
jgi:V8-like Glu-specific endopeptidase